MRDIIGISILHENVPDKLRQKVNILKIGISDGEKNFSFDDFNELFGFFKVSKWRGKIVSANLRRDGEFIISYMMNNGFKPAIKKEYEDDLGKLNHYKDKFKWAPLELMQERDFKMFVTDKGAWYSITFKYKKKVYHIVDLMKLGANTLGELSESFLGIRVDDFSEYDVVEKDIFNDSMIVEARAKAAVLVYRKLIAVTDGYDTIGMNCLRQFVDDTFSRGWKGFRINYPNLYEIKLSESWADNAGEYIRMAYGGGYMYLNKKYLNRKSGKGFYIDVSSLYTSRMHSKSGEIYPVGIPEYGEGKCENPFGHVVFQTIECEFNLRQGKIPFIKIHNTFLYPHGVNLKTSDYYCVAGRRRHRVKLTLKWEELLLFFEHYDVRGLMYVDYVRFRARAGIFDFYIDRWWDKKVNAKNNAERYIAKLYQNNLPGKFASSDDIIFRVPREHNGLIGYDEKRGINHYPGYIAVGASVLSNSRVFQIKNCQKVYDEGRLIYSDTDCIFGEGEIPEYLDVDNNKLGAYKIEGKFEWAYFNGMKRYIAKMEEGEGIESLSGSKFKFSAAGLSERGKKLFLASIGEPPRDSVRNLTFKEKKFICEGRKVEDFNCGISIPGQRTARRVEGGIIYEEGFFTILEKEGMINELL